MNHNICNHIIVLSTVCFVLLFGSVTAAAETGGTPGRPEGQSQLDHITLRLKWYHQFQFAGYYAALEQGYYREAGLDVTIQAGDPSSTSVESVVSGSAEYAISGPEVLFNYLNGKPVVALAAIFQHSPRILITLADSGIVSPQDLIGRRVMNYQGLDGAEYTAVLLSEGVDLNRIEEVQVSHEISDLIDGRVDSFTGYLTNEPYYLQQRDIAYNTFRPVTYGIDFYGDVLFTSQSEAQQHPQRTEAFRRASLRGWQYAMQHEDEIIDLLLEKYNCNKTREHLQFEAGMMRELILPDLIELGHMNPGRWQHIADTYQSLGMVDEVIPLDEFIYQSDEAMHDTWERNAALTIGTILLLAGLITGALLLFNFRLRTAIKSRTAELSRINQQLQQDIQARREVETALRRSEQNISNIFDNALVGIIVAADDNRILQVNPQLAIMFGASQAELLSSNYLDLVVAEEVAEVRESWERMLQSPTREFISERSYVRRDGTVIDCFVTGRVLRLDPDEPPQFLFVLSDISERKAMEAALRSSEEFNRTIIENSPLGISVRSRTGQLLSCNRSWQKIWGYTDETIEEQKQPRKQLVFNERDYYLGKFTPAVRDIYMHGGTLSVPYAKTTISAPHASKWVAQNFYAIVNAEDEVDRVVILTEDITRRMEAKEALQKSEQRLARAQEIAHLGNWVRDLATGTIAWSDENYRIIGYVPGEFALTPESITATMHPEDRERIAALLQPGGIAGNQLEYEYRVLHKDGSVRQLHEWMNVVRSNQGKALRIEGTCQDITERKQAEEQLRHSREQLMHSQKMEAIGVLAGGIAHDFNNILFAILGNADMATRELGAGHPVREYLGEISTAGQRAAELVKQILSFSRHEERKPVVVMIDRMISEVARLIRSTMPTTIEIELQMEAESATMIAEPTAIHQVLMNLCTNAGQAMLASGGVLRVRLETLEIDAESASKYPLLKPGPHALITVSDSGSGIAPEDLEHIFEPFYTTKPVGKGTGMGLAVVHGIVASLKGMITVDSVVGQGTAFHVHLPLSAQVSAAPVQSMAELEKGKERVLYIDDEEAIANMAGRLLGGLGYRVTALTDSREGLARFRRDPQAYDIIITDQTMPGLTGGELAREVLKIRPGMPVILCTGYSHVMNRQTAKTSGISDYLVKPLTRENLSTAIRRALDGNGPAPD